MLLLALKACHPYLAVWLVSCDGYRPLPLPTTSWLVVSIGGVAAVRNVIR